MLIVFDIDGTLADINHRLDYIRSKPKNWKAFEAGIANDSLNEPVWKVYKSLTLYGIHDIVLATGRSESSRKATEAWLRRWTIDEYKKLYMRPADDYRTDDIVKREMLDQIIADYGRKPDMVFEDRPRVIRMWRDNGIFVFNVYQGEEDF
jgi:phosphoglycolate phosphatase-like HAD superfamily hydrolase